MPSRLSSCQGLLNGSRNPSLVVSQYSLQCQPSFLELFGPLGASLSSQSSLPEWFGVIAPGPPEELDSDFLWKSVTSWVMWLPLVAKLSGHRLLLRPTGHFGHVLLSTSALPNCACQSVLFTNSKACQPPRIWEPFHRMC